MKRMVAVRMTLYSLFTALTAIGTFPQIPLPNLGYFTLQFFFVLMAGMLLGACLRALSAVLYVLAGLPGILVFAVEGGISYALCLSLGFLLDFTVTVFCSGWTTQHGQRKWKTCFPAVLAGLLAAYKIGLTYKHVVLNYYTGTEIPFSLLLLSCFPLDLPKSIPCSILVTYVALRFPVAVCRGIKQKRVYARQIRKQGVVAEVLTNSSLHLKSKYTIERSRCLPAVYQTGDQQAVYLAVICFFQRLDARDRNPSSLYEETSNLTDS